MAQKYAKDQPPGFTNCIERVAIVGVCHPLAPLPPKYFFFLLTNE